MSAVIEKSNPSWRFRRIAGEPLFCDDASFRHVLVKIVVEVVSAGAQLREMDRDGFTERDHLLAIELEALELDGFLTGVDDLDGKLLAARHGQRPRGKLVVFEADLLLVLRQRRAHGCKRDCRRHRREKQFGCWHG